MYKSLELHYQSNVIDLAVNFSAQINPSQLRSIDCGVNPCLLRLFILLGGRLTGWLCGFYLSVFSFFLSFCVCWCRWFGPSFCLSLLSFFFFFVFFFLFLFSFFLSFFLCWLVFVFFARKKGAVQLARLSGCRPKESKALTKYPQGRQRGRSIAPNEFGKPDCGL